MGFGIFLDVAFYALIVMFLDFFLYDRPHLLRFNRNRREYGSFTRCVVTAQTLNASLPTRWGYRDINSKAISTEPFYRCPVGYTPLNPTEQDTVSELCVQYQTRHAQYECPPEWTLTSGNQCVREESAQAEYTCEPPSQRLANICVTDEVIAQLSLSCPHGYTLVNASWCFYVKDDESTCIKRKTMLATLSCPPNTMKRRSRTNREVVCVVDEDRTGRTSDCWDDVHSDTVDVSSVLPVLSCAGSFLLKDDRCERITYEVPRYQCPSNSTLVNTQCISTLNKCDTTPDQQLCIHSLSAQKHPFPGERLTPPFRSPTRNLISHNSKYTCPKHYLRYMTANDARCIYVSSSSYCASPHVSVQMVDMNCQRVLDPPLSLCRKGTYDANVKMCSLRDISAPQRECPSALVYDPMIDKCVDKRYDDTPFLTEQIRNTQDALCNQKIVARPFVTCPPGYRLDPEHIRSCVQYITESPVFTCPIGYVLRKHEQRFRQYTQPFCENHERRAPSSQCPTHFHQANNNMCVRQLFRSLVPVCPSGYQWRNTICIKRLISAATVVCPDRYTPQNITRSSGDGTKSVDTFCVKKLYANAIPS